MGRARSEGIARIVAMVWRFINECQGVKCIGSTTDWSLVTAQRAIPPSTANRRNVLPADGGRVATLYGTVKQFASKHSQKLYPRTYFHASADSIVMDYYVEKINSIHSVQ